MKKLNLNPTKKDLRQFAATLAIGFGIIGGLFFLRHRPTAAVSMWITAGSVALVSILIPFLGRLFYIVWMSIGFVLGAVMSRVVMALIFYLILTPVALVFLLFKRDSLRRFPARRSDETHWKIHPEITDPANYEHLF